MSKHATPLLILTLLMPLLIMPVEPVFAYTQDSWASKAPMQQERSGLRAATLNGKIYAIGGTTQQGAFPYTGGPVGTNEEYDPVTDRWTYKTPKPSIGGGFGIAVYQNKIYCINDDGNEVYDPATDTWENKTSMPTPRFSLDANVVDGKIYLIGGYDPSLPNGGDATNINEVYDPETDTWTTKTPMPVRKCNYASAVVGDKIHIIGGYSIVDNREMNLHQIYDTKTDKWSYGEPSPLKLESPGAGVTSGLYAPVQIYVFAEMWDISTDEYSVRVYDPESDRWKDGADIPTRRGVFGVAVLDDLFYVIGGVTSYSPMPFDLYPTHTKYATNERYTPLGYGTISPVVELVSPRNQSYNVTDVSLDFTVNKPVSLVEYSLDGQENLTVTGNTTLTELSNGFHNVTIFARDEFGNYGVSDAFFNIEVPAPETFPTTLVLASVIVVLVVALAGAGFLLYRKRGRGKTQ